MESSKQNLTTLRHSCSHVLAQAVKELWPETKLGIGPATPEGFYYDFDKSQKFSLQDLSKIEEKMRQIIKDDLPFIQKKIKKEKAKAIFEEREELYKLKLLEEIPEEEVSIYQTGDRFLDLCRGPHLKSTGEIPVFKLLNIAGSYWHGIETNPMLQRIYGTAFFSKEELDQYLKNLEEAKKRDHRRLGKSLELYNIYYEQAGAGLVFYHPKGAILRAIIEDYEEKEHLKRGYQQVISPHIMTLQLWQRSGHLKYYRENMYIFKDQKEAYVLKPMNCPGHMLIYSSKLRSWKELPLRYFELGTVYRKEKSGVLHGLLRVRGFTQDDAHIFCLPEQLKEEIKNILDFIQDCMKDFGFRTLQMQISTRPQQAIGNLQTWRKATELLKEALEEKEINYEIKLGEGAFYGPKIDVSLKDALGRSWQCATVQCDFFLPQRFDLYYIDSQGKKKEPVMIHRVILGSLERFIATLIEHYAGALPLWLAPVQLKIIPITDQQITYAKKIDAFFRERNLRTALDLRQETLQRRIRDAEEEKVPYILIIGQREEKAKKIAIRKRKLGDQGTRSLEEFTKELVEEIEKKKIF